MAAKTETRTPLSRERILQAALALVDERGIESLTMRGLGQSLGFEAMSLYNHVANKDDVLDGILDLVLAETKPPTPSGDWRAAVRDSAVSVHSALRRHPWAASLLMAPSHIRAARLSYMDSLLGRLRESGFDADTTYHAYHVLDGHIFGFSIWHTSHTMTAEDAAGMEEAVGRIVPAETYPYLYEHAQQHFAEGPHQEVSAFEFGLDLILESLENVRSSS